MVTFTSFNNSSSTYTKTNNLFDKSYMFEIDLHEINLFQMTLFEVDALEIVPVWQQTKMDLNRIHRDPCTVAWAEALTHICAKFKFFLNHPMNSKN